MKSDEPKELPDDWSGISKLLIALGDEERQRVLLLFDRGEGLSLGQIADALNLSRGVAAHQVRIMAQSNLLVSQRVGREDYFWVNKTFLEDSLSGLLRHVRDRI